MRRIHINKKPKGARPPIVPPPQHKGPTLYPQLFKCECGCTTFSAGTWGGEPCWYCTRCSSPHDPGKFKPKPIGQYKVTVRDLDDGGLGQDFKDEEYRFFTEAEANAFKQGLQRANAHPCRAW